MPPHPRSSGSHRWLVRHFALLVLPLVAVCESERSDPLTVWIEPPRVYRLGEPDAEPITLSSTLVDEVRAALLRSDHPETLVIRIVGERHRPPSYPLDLLDIKEVACRAGVTSLQVYGGVPASDPFSNRFSYDSEVSAAWLPPSCAPQIEVWEGTVERMSELLPEDSESPYELRE